MSQLNLRTVKLGNNADTSKNFLIQVPAVADGTLTITRENGTAIASVDATGKVTIANLNVQTWQNVTGSRTLSTLYTNSTAQSITVIVGVLTNINTAVQLITYVGGIAMGYCYAPSIVGQQFGLQSTFIVPPGSTYQVVAANATVAGNWMELR